MLLAQQCTMKVDSYSFGVLLWVSKCLWLVFTLRHRVWGSELAPRSWKRVLAVGVCAAPDPEHA